jgi:hypothetical protein
MSIETIARSRTVPSVENTPEAFGVTPVNKVKRQHKRGRYDRKTVYEILDAALVCHIAHVIDGRPYCTPTAFWREGDHLYWHGSSASRMIRTQSPGRVSTTRSTIGRSWRSAPRTSSTMSRRSWR